MIGSGLNPAEYVPGLKNPLAEYHSEVKRSYPALSKEASQSIDFAFRDHYSEMLQTKHKVFNTIYAAYKPWAKEIFQIYRTEGEAAALAKVTSLLDEQAVLFDNVLRKAVDTIGVKKKWVRTVTAIIRAIEAAAKTTPEYGNALRGVSTALKTEIENLYTRYAYFYYSTAAVKESFIPNQGFDFREFLGTIGFFKK